jgi:hypothetical protein
LVANASTAVFERTETILEENMEFVTVRNPRHLSAVTDVCVHRIHSIVWVTNIYGERTRYGETRDLWLLVGAAGFHGKKHEQD